MSNINITAITQSTILDVFIFVFNNTTNDLIYHNTNKKRYIPTNSYTKVLFKSNVVALA